MINKMINGKTRVLAVIGDPISHSISPEIHNTVASLLGHNIAYTPFHVTPENLGAAVHGAHALGIYGLNVTIPHKKNVIEFLARLDDTAAIVGTVNTLKYSPVGYIGYNTDVAGIKKVFDTHNIDISQKKVAVIGAGGSAYAAVAMALTEGAAEIYILNRTLENAISVARHFKTYYNTYIEASNLDNASTLHPNIIIQTTAVGFAGLEGLSPIADGIFFHNAEAVLDIIYKPWKTEFLGMAAAENPDCLCLNGFDMLIYQGLASYGIWQDISFESSFVQNIRDLFYKYYVTE